MRIYKTYGDEVIAKVIESPYRLALDIHGMGFKTADLIAGKLGVAGDPPLRAHAGVRHVLQELSDDGHCAAPREKLIEQSVNLLGIPAPVLEDAVRAKVELEKLVEEDIDGKGCPFLAPLHHAEVGITLSLNRLRSRSPPWDEIDADKALRWVEGKTGLTLSASQVEAVRLALSSKALVIKEDPAVGTGL